MDLVEIVKFFYDWASLQMDEKWEWLFIVTGVIHFISFTFFFVVHISF